MSSSNSVFACVVWVLGVDKEAQFSRAKSLALIWFDCPPTQKSHLFPRWLFSCKLVSFYSENRLSLSLSNLSFDIWTTAYVLGSSVSLQGPHQRSLLKNLLKDYNRMERPVGNDSQPLTVVFTVSMIQIMDVVGVYIHKRVWKLLRILFAAELQK